MSRLVISLSMILLATPVLGADEEKSQPTPEVRAMQKLMDEKKVWSKIGKRSEWRSGGFYILQDMDDLSPLTAPENIERESLVGSSKTLLNIDKRNGVVQCADWSFHGPKTAEVRFLSIDVQVYVDEKSCQKSCDSDAEIAKMIDGTVKRRGKRTIVIGAGTKVYEGRYAVSVSTGRPSNKKEVLIAETIQREFKKLVKAEQKADAKRKKAEEKRKRDAEKDAETKSGS